MLFGTNDAKSGNWEPEAFEKDWDVQPVMFGNSTAKFMRMSANLSKFWLQLFGSNHEPNEW